MVLLRSTSKQTVQETSFPEEKASTSKPQYQRLKQEAPIEETRSPTARLEARAIDPSQRLLYVGQGEVATCNSSQVDVLWTDRMTTCHCVVLTSLVPSPNNNNDSTRLCSLTHVDAAVYEDCLWELVHYHVQQGATTLNVHIVGGYCDARKLSAPVTEWLRQLFLHDMKQAYQGRLSMVLQTLCVGKDNTTLKGGPLVRGVAVSTRTGHVTAVQTTRPHSPHSSFLYGPEPLLRSARLWTTRPRQLYNIYDTDSNTVSFDPFDGRPVVDDLDFYLNMSDEQLLRSCSTSPDTEDDSFCKGVRDTFLFMQTNSIYFEKQASIRRVYGRVGATNDWKAIGGF